MATLSKEEIKGRLHPAHLEIPEVHALQEALASEMEPIAEEPPKPKDDPRAQREYSFDFSWKDGKGKVWKGRFTNRVLNIRERQMAGVLRAKLSGNTPVEALDEMTREINLMISHLSYSLTEKPDWAKDLQTLDDVRLVQELYMEVASHEATFLGYGSAPSAG